MMSGLFLLLTVLSTPPPPQLAPTPLSDSEVARIKKEVTEAVHHYYRLFTERNMKALPHEVFYVPLINFGPDGVQVDATPEAVTARFEASLKRLLESGWDRSEFPNPCVSVLHASGAIASGKFYRYKKDGTLLSENAVTYVLGKTPSGWRIVSFTGHGVDRVISCGD